MRLTRLTIFLLFISVFSVYGQSTESCRKSTEGTDFWFGFMESRNYNNGHYTEITVTSGNTCNYKIYIGKSNLPFITGTVTPNLPVKVRIDWKLVEAIGSENIQAKAIHLVSDNPLNVYALNWCPSSADVALIFPKESLGNEYYAMCYTPHVHMNGTNPGNGRNSEFLIVAAEDSTEVWITPTKITDKLKPANLPFRIWLSKGELYQVQSANLNNLTGQGDLTGSYITSDKPVAFYSGSLSTTVPGDASVSAWDHLYEQIPPLQTWGRKFIAVPLKTRSQDYFRVLAAEDGTTVRIGNKMPVSLIKGQHYEFILTSTEPSLIESDKPILLAQFSASNSVDKPVPWPPIGTPPPPAIQPIWDGDPFMVIVSPVNQTREKVAFVAYDSDNITNKYFINVVVKDDAVGKIKLDNNLITFQSLIGTGYSYAQVNLITKGNHIIESTEAGKGFIAYVYGFGGVESYGYGVGFNLDIVLDLGSNINEIGKLLVRCDGADPLTLNAGNAFDKYLWSTGDTTSTIQVSNAGWYKVTASINGGCELKDSVELQISTPSVDLGSDTTICNPATIVLDASDQFASFQWSTPQDSLTDQSITASSAGIYAVEAINKYGCKARDTIRVSFADKPRLDLSKLDTLMCGKYTTTLDVSSDKTVTWLLESPDNKVNISNLTASVLPADFGTYTVTLTAKDESSCATDTTFNLGFFAAPTVVLGRDSTICNPEAIVLNAGDQFPVYLWSTTETTPSVIVKKDGIYSVNITDKNGCKTGDTITVAFTDKPKLDLSKLDTLMCGKYTTTLDISADKPVTWLLESPDTKVNISNLTASVLPADFGTYTVTLTAKDEFSCTTDTSFRLGFYKTPVVDFTIDAKKCSGYNLNVSYVGDAEPVIANFNWVFGGDTIANAVRLNSLVVPLGINRSQRDLSLTVTQDGCSNSYIQKDIKVIPNLDLHILDHLGCEPFNAGFLAENTEVVVYDWDFGDGTPVERREKNPFHTYQNDGFYDVKLTITTVVASGEGCVNEVKIDSLVHVAPIPTVGFTPLPAECLEKGEHQISYGGTADTLDRYYWDISKLDLDEIIQNPDTTQGPLIFNLKNKPQAIIRLSVTSKYGCLSDTANILVKRIPDFSIDASSNAGCPPFEPMLTGKANDPVDQLNYRWDFGDDSTGTGDSVSHIYAAHDKQYDVVLVALSTTTGCSDTISRKDFLRTYPIPTAGFKPLSAECLTKGDNDISYAGTGDTLDRYIWDLSKLDLDEIIQNPDTTQGPLIFNLKNKPQANIRLSVTSKYGCVSDTATVLVKRIPDFSVLTSLVAGCTPIEPLFSAITNDPVDQVDYNWDFGDGSTGTGDQVEHEYSEPDHKYDVTLFALSTTTGCADTLLSPALVWAYPKPEAAFGMDNAIVYNDKPTVNFSNLTTGADTYSWDFGDESKSDEKDPSHYYTVTGYRTVLLEAFNEFLCSDTVTHQLLVAFDRIFPPNGFSPNAPNAVDREFKLGSDGVAAEGYHLTVLSRWNDIVFETRDEIRGWNGQMPNGSIAPAGVYVWILNFSDFLGRRHRQTGTVTLVY